MAEEMNEGMTTLKKHAKVKIALTSTNGSKILVDSIEGYKKGYNVDGIAVIDGKHAIMLSLTESAETFGKQTEDLPDTDERYQAVCSMSDYQGNKKTDFVIGFFGLGEGTAPVVAKSFGWLPDSGEIGLIANNREAINVLLEEVGATPVGEGKYWTSVKYSKRYIWHCDMEAKELRMYKGMASLLKVRPVKSVEGYTEV